MGLVFQIAGGIVLAVAVLAVIINLDEVLEHFFGMIKVLAILLALPAAIGVLVLGYIYFKPKAPEPVSSSAHPKPSVSKTSPKSEIEASSRVPTEQELLNAVLMEVVFGKDYRPAIGQAVARQPTVKKRNEIDTFLVTPEATNLLPSGEMALVTNSILGSDKGAIAPSHADGGILSVYILKKTKERWQIARRHENIAEIGTSGNIGVIEWIQLASNKPGLAIIGSGTWQGYHIEWLELFDLTADSMVSIGLPNHNIQSDNNGACMPEDVHCWDIRGKFHFLPSRAQSPYDDLEIEFSGTDDTVIVEISSHSDQPVARISRQVSGRVRYSFDGKEYQQIEGKNIVPEI